LGLRAEQFDANQLPLLKSLVKMAKHSWMIERDYEELKQD